MRYLQNLKGGKIANYLIIVITMSLSIYIVNNRSLIFLYLGDGFFGKWTYDLSWAETFYNLSIKSGAAPMWSNYQLSRIHFIKGKLDKAVQFADTELANYPYNCKANYIRGLAYGYKEELNKAIKDFEYFNSCMPLTWAGHNDLAWLWYRLGNATESVKVIERVNIIYEYNPWIQNTYGVALMNLHRYDEARLALNNAKLGADALTPNDWGKAYPGNDPLIYTTGLDKMRKNINDNLKLLSTYTGETN
jgi:hypothetical protein